MVRIHHGPPISLVLERHVFGGRDASERWIAGRAQHARRSALPRAGGTQAAEPHPSRPTIPYSFRWLCLRSFSSDRNDGLPAARSTWSIRRPPLQNSHVGTRGRSSFNGSNHAGLRHRNRPMVRQQCLKAAAGPAGTGIVASQLFHELLPAMHEAAAWLHPGFRWIALAALAGDFKRMRWDRCVSWDTSCVWSVGAGAAYAMRSHDAMALPASSCSTASTACP